MAKEVELTFKAKLLAKAEELANSVKVIVGQTKKTTAEVSRNVSDANRELKKRSRIAARAESKLAKRQARLGKRAGRIREKTDRFSAKGAAQLAAVMHFGAKARMKAGNALNLASAKSIQGVAKAAPGLITGPAGMAVAAILAVVTSVMSEHARLVDLRLERFDEAFTAKIERALFEADYMRRLREDPHFEKQEARKQFAIMREQQAELARRGLTARDLGLLENF